MDGRLLCASLLVGSALLGCTEECEDRRDCAAGFECVEAACVRVVDPSGGRRVEPVDAGPGNFTDAGLEAGVAVDGGPDAPDTGPDGGANGAPGDAGAVDTGPDGGVTPAVGRRGLVWVSELRTGGATAFVTFGEFLDESAVTFMERSTLLTDPAGNRCALVVRVPTAGQPVGLAARQILVSPGPQPNASFTMQPVGNGRFEPAAPPVERIFTGSNGAVFTIESDGSSQSLEDLVATVEAPPAILEISPPEGATVNLAGIPPLAWVPSGDPFARVSVELSDRDRARTARCDVPDTGAYELPGNLVNQFLALTPERPIRLEIRHDREATATAVAGGQSFDVVFRASWGARFEVQ